MTDYTLKLEDEVFNTMLLYDDEEDCIELINFLNGSNFRSFGDALTDIIKMKNEEEDGAHAGDFLIECSKEKKIHIADNRTIKSWFEKEKRPRKGLESRLMIFKIAFCLELSVEETKKLFETVYLDRAYNPRDYHDVIYYYCLKHSKSYAVAEGMLKRVNFVQSTHDDSTVFTNFLMSEVGRQEQEDFLIDYINNHPHNFTINNVSAKTKKEEYMVKAIETAKKERETTDPYWLTEEEKKKKDQEEKMLSYSYRRNQNSINFLYETITSYGRNKDASGTKFSFKNSLLPKEIKSCFPTPHTFSEEEPSYEELRKIIILLASYIFWSDMKVHQEYDFDDYRLYIDMVLTEIGYLPLYAGNPYDWLFLCCTVSKDPLLLFRDILAEATA